MALLQTLQSANISICNDGISGLIHNLAHVVSKITDLDTDLPNAPPLHEALAGPEWDLWHTVVLEELAIIKSASIWTLVNHTPQVQNVISC